MTKQKLKEWNVLLKKDQDFCYTYLLEIVLHKLNNMRKCFETGHLMSCDSNVLLIEALISVGNRILADLYEDKYIQFNTIDKEFESLLGNKLSKEDYIRLINLSWGDKQADINTFFNTLRDNLLLLWD